MRIVFRPTISQHNVSTHNLPVLCYVVCVKKRPEWLPDVFLCVFLLISFIGTSIVFLRSILTIEIINLLYINLMPNHKDEDGPEFSAVVFFICYVICKQLKDFVFIENRFRLTGMY